MLLFGGSSESDVGARYVLASNSWKPMAAPPVELEARREHSAVWTGNRMIIWGGSGGGLAHNAGASYDPLFNEWAMIEPAPIAARSNHRAIWTGTRMIVWGGYGDADLADGAAYDPLTATWTKLPASPLSGRSSFVMLMRSGRILIWSGQSAFGFERSGAEYDPGLGTWTSTADGPSPPRVLYAAPTTTGFFSYGAAIMTTTAPFLGLLDRGLVLDGSSWEELPAAPSTALANPKRAPGATWCVDNRCFVWSGHVEEGGALKVAGGGASYELATKKWTAMPTSNEPPARTGAATMLLGRSALVWGGQLASGNANDGAIYTP